MKMTVRLPGNDVPRDLAEVHERYAPMLLSAVRALVKKGLDVKSDEYLDLVHDFYIEELPGALDRYDSGRGKFSTYLYRAFVYFACRRATRTTRQNELLVPLDEGRDEAVPERQ